MTPSIFRYLDYRTYLRDLFDSYRAKTKKSARTAFQEAGFKSLGHFYLILSGKTHLNESRLLEVAGAWGTPLGERDYLLRVREFCTNKSFSQKEKILLELEEMRAAKNVRLLSREEVEQLHAWYAIPLLEALGTSFGNWSPKQLSQVFQIGSEEILDVLRLLERLGLVRKTEDGYERIGHTLEGYMTSSFTSLRALHREMLRLAMNSIEDIDENKRALMMLTLPIQSHRLQSIKEEAHKLFQKLNRQFDAGKKADAIYQINLQAFPLISEKDG